MAESTSLEQLQARLTDILEQVRHENGLLNDRMTWMWLLQGFLFASLGLVVSGSAARFVALMVCLVGVVSCVSIGCSLVIGARLLNSLNGRANQLSEEIDTRLGLCPTVVTVTLRRCWGFLLPWNMLPWFLAAVWLALAVYAAL
jgi:hypothetical protein